MSKSLAGRIALVTGGSSGIGRAIARRFAAAGAAVAVSGRRPEPLAAVVQEIEEAGGRALAVRGDVAVPAEALAMVTRTVDAFGGLHLLVNNAGIALGGPLETMSEAEIDAVVDVDLKGPIHVTRAALSHLAEHRDAGGAAVINVSSSVTFLPPRNFSVYSAAKAGLEMLTRCWALDWGEHGIRVNAIAAGVVDTPLFGGLPDDARRDLFEGFVTKTPLGRIGTPADIASLALFLAGPEASFLTGAIIPADGGLSAGE